MNKTNAKKLNTISKGVKIKNLFSLHSLWVKIFLLKFIFFFADKKPITKQMLPNKIRNIDGNKKALFSPNKKT